MPWGVIIPAAASVIGGVLGSKGSSSAASSQAAASQAATAEQQREFDYLQGAYQPGRNLGYGADALLAQLFGMSNPLTSSYSFDQPPGAGGAPQSPHTFMGMNLDDLLSRSGHGPAAGGMPGQTTARASVGAPGTAGPPNYSAFFNSPGYQFALQQGTQAINRGASARGNIYAPNTLMDINNYAQGQAATRYNDYVNQLLQMAGLGSAAVNGTAQAGTTMAANIGAGLMSTGNANASGALGSANAWSTAINQIGGLNWGKLFNNGSGEPTTGGAA